MYQLKQLEQKEEIQLYNKILNEEPKVICKRKKKK